VICCMTATKHGGGLNLHHHVKVWLSVLVWLCVVNNLCHLHLNLSKTAHRRTQCAFLLDHRFVLNLCFQPHTLSPLRRSLLALVSADQFSTTAMCRT